MIKQQEKNLAAGNQAIKAQQQLLQNLHPKEHSFQASRNQAAIKARPRPRLRTEKAYNSQHILVTSLPCRLNYLSYRKCFKWISECKWKQSWTLTEVFKGPRLPSLGILDSQTHYKPTETFQYIHFSSCYPFSTRKGFIKGEALLIASFKNQLSQGEFFHTQTSLNSNKDSVTEAIPQRSFIKSWLKFSSRNRGSS